MKSKETTAWKSRSVSSAGICYVLAFPASNIPLHPVPIPVESPSNGSKEEYTLTDMLNDETGVVVAYPASLYELHVVHIGRQHDDRHNYATCDNTKES